MRQPTINPAKRRRQQRLMRTGIGVVIVIAVAALVANLVGGGEDPTAAPPETPTVAFTAKTTSYGDGGPARKAKAVKRADVNAERDAIVSLLNAWYQDTFVDPSVFVVDAEEFPSEALLNTFDEGTRETVATDLDTLTLGSERTDFARVEPSKATADLTFFFQNSKAPKLAVADVRFDATGTLKDDTAFPVTITQRATFHFHTDGNGWRIVYYEAKQSQDSLLPTASPSEEASS